MAAFISRKQSLLILLAGLCMASGVVLLLDYFFSGPRLGPHYDWLLGRRSMPPLARDVLLIGTDEIVEGGDVFTVLLALSEFDASALVIEVPVLGSSSSGAHSDEEIKQLLGDEYVLLGSNIRNLFEAIRVGSVPPSESGAYVENLVALAERGRERLESALIRGAGVDSGQLARAAEVFAAGHAARVFEAPDIRSAPPESNEIYSRPRPDHDGRIRRVAAGGHIVYRALGSRWDNTAIELIEHDQVLTAGDFRFPLDSNGNLLFERLYGKNSFRRVEMDSFRQYAAADREMRRLLKDAGALGFFSGLMPERTPSILYDYALDLREAVLDEPTADRLAAWIHAREEYFLSLDELLNTGIETNLVDAYELLIATEELEPGGIDKLRALRDELIASFAAMREKHGELENIRASLTAALNTSFCIMGETGSELVDVSACFANALLTGRCITPGRSMYIIFWSLLAVFILLLTIHFMRPVILLLTGICVSALCALGFGWSFIVSGYWIDPLIPALSCMSGTLVMFCCGFLIRHNAIRRFRFAYSPAVSTSCLSELIRAGRPSLSETIIGDAAVVAVKKSDFLTGHDNRVELTKTQPLTKSQPPAAVSPDSSRHKPNDDTLVRARELAEFHAEVSREFTKAGAAFIGCEGDIAFVCFGSPLERVFLERAKPDLRYEDEANAGGRHPARAAFQCVAALVRGGHSSWHYGIDYGSCAFYWSAGTGYSAYGRPLIRARALSSLTARHNARVLISDAVREKLNGPGVRKLRVAGKANSGMSESFFEPLFEIKPVSAPS